MNISEKAAAVLLALTTVLTFSAAAHAAPKIAPPPSDFKVSFIPKPWEVNVERGYLFLDKDWKFFKGAPQRIKSIDTAAQGISNPKKYKLRDGAEAPIGEKCEHPESADCDDSSWISVNVPFNWYDLGEEMDGFIGTVWYRKTLSIDKKQLSGRAEIQFWGAYYRAWVYVNGEKVGFHEGGYTPFSFDVTRLLKPGRNQIAVRVDNSIDSGDIRIGDWWNYGGLHREAMLVFTSASYIKDLDVKTTLSPDLNKADVDFRIDTAGNGADEARAYIYRLSDKGKTLIGSVSRKLSRTGPTSLPWRVSKPALWSPESPSLYFVKTVLFSNNKPIDGLGSIFGIRKFEVRGMKLFLNNKQVFFRGVNRHDEFFHGEFPDAGRVATEQERIKDFKLIKEMRANGMRTGHYPNHPYNYYITDRLGIMVIEEGGPVNSELDDDVLIDKIKTQMSEMIARDKNHPSIVIWSIGNEFGGDRFLKYIKAAAAHTRSLDSRPITFTETAERIVTEGYNYVDILSRNEYAGWYIGVL
ncbi:MAG TPA: glycoside hydrolase family 2 TIM barrel-domain containing protein, partial [bacterium]|nr:glycoside hydrolase family 2 TIM barrel-domain containing protein [bacterium]